MVLRPWLDGRIPAAQGPGVLLAAGRADVEVQFVELVGDSAARVYYPADSENEVVCSAAEGQYSVGAVCPAVLGADGRVAMVYPPLTVEGDPVFVGETTATIIESVEAVSDDVQATNAIVEAHEGKISAVEEGVQDTKDLLAATDTVIAGMNTTLTQTTTTAASALTAAQATQTALTNLRVGGRNFLLSDPQVLPLSTNSSADYPLTQGVDERGAWISGHQASAPDVLYLSTFVTSTWTAGKGTVYSEDLYPVTGPLVQSVEVWCESAVQVRMGAANAANQSVPAGTWTRVFTTLLEATRPGGLFVVGSSLPAGTKLYLRDWMIQRGTAPTGWVPPLEWEAVQVEAVGNTAGTALHVANLAQELAAGLVSLDAEPPESPPEGQIWVPTNEDGQATGLWRWSGTEWETVTNIVGLLLVPTADGGQTLIGPDGVEATSIVADILRTDVLYADVAGVQTLVITDIPRSHLAEDVGEALATAEDLGSRIVLSGGQLTIARNRVSDNEPLTAVTLGATSLDFVVDDKAVAYIDSELEQMSIANGLFRDSMTVGSHQVRTLPGSQVTIWQAVN